MTIWNYLVFSFLVCFFRLLSESFPRWSFEWLFVEDFVELLLFSAFFNVWLEICRPGRNLLVVDVGETNFLFPFDFFSLPFLVALDREKRTQLKNQFHRVLFLKKMKKILSTRMMICLLLLHVWQRVNDVWVDFLIVI